MATENLSNTELAHKIIAELMPLADMLSPSDGRIIKMFCEYILQNRSSISNATSLLPLEAALVVIQVKEHEKNSHELTEIHNQLQEIRRKIKGLSPGE